MMEYKWVFQKSTNEIIVSKKTTPDFYRLYQQCILLALQEQGILDETQVLYGLDMLHHQEGK